MKLKDRVTLITGAGSGFGQTTALMMAKEGAKIGVNDIDPKKVDETLAKLKEIGGAGLALPADVSKVDQVKKMFEKLVAAWGTIDILVNNAGFALPSKWPDLIQAVNQRFLKAVGELQTLGKVQESLKITGSKANQPSTATASTGSRPISRVPPSKSATRRAPARFTSTITQITVSVQIPAGSVALSVGKKMER